MIAAQHDLYEVLGVAPTATAEEIRAGYYRSVRKHPPEKDGDGFRRVQAAYDVLGQPGTRKQYDETSRSDPETRDLIDRGRKLLEEGSADAVPLIKRALARQPQSAIIRDLLTQAFMVAEDYEEALTQARKALGMEPDNPVYSVRVGDVFRALDRDAEAMPYYRKAVYLDRSDAQFLVKLAHLLNYLDKPDEAVKLVDDAIRRDGKVDFDDFIYFQCLCTIYTLRGRYGDLEATHLRIREILPPDPDARSYVAWFYFIHALQMAEAGNFEGAVRSIGEAASIDSSLPELEETAKRLRDGRATLRQLESLQKDEGIDLPLRMAVVSLGYHRLLGQSQRFDEIFEQATQAVNRLLATQGIDLATQSRALRRRYPAVGRMMHDLLDKVEELASSTPKLYIDLTCPACGERGHADRPTVQTLIASGMPAAVARGALQSMGEQGVLRSIVFTCDTCGTRYNGLSERATAPAPSQPSSSSGCFVVTAACGDESAYPVRVLRRYRDRRLVTRAWGRVLIRIYASLGPRLARFVARRERLKRLTLALCEWLAARLDRM